MKPSLSILALCTAFASACSADEPNAAPVSFLAFGDSGYHLDYLDADDVTPPFKSRAAFADRYRAEWMEDKKPLRDFELPALTFHQGFGSYVATSGMMPVAKAMKAVCAEKNCDFAVMLGDNIYPDGATGGPEDAVTFQKIFDIPFGKLGNGTRDFKTYVTLGNHDWHSSREGALAQVAYLEQHPAFYMDGPVYRVKPASAHGLVELFVIDTELMLGGTTVYDDKLADDGSEIRNTKIKKNDPWAMPQTELEKNQIQWLEDALKNSDAKWKFIIAHHPFWASGVSKFEQGHALRKILTPVMCRYADAVFAGHEHSMEIHDDTCAGTGAGDVPMLPNLVSGAASKQRGMNSAFMAYQNKANPEKITHFARGMMWGFMHVTLDGDDATVKIYGTPNDQSGAADDIFTYQFHRRSQAASR